MIKCFLNFLIFGKAETSIIYGFYYVGKQIIYKPTRYMSTYETEGLCDIEKGYEIGYTFYSHISIIHDSALSRNNVTLHI